MLPTLFIVITSDRSVAQLINDRKNSLVPADIRSQFSNNRRSNLTLIAIYHNSTSDFMIANQRINEMVLPYQGVIVAAEDMSVISEYASDAFFLVSFDVAAAKSNIANYFRKLISSSIKNFKDFMSLFNDMKYRKIFLLPTHIFACAAVSELQTDFRPVGTGFSASMRKNLTALRSRIKPKQGGRDEARYLIDDDNRHYSYGHELHGRCDTKIPPHNSYCSVCSLFRFGARYEDKKHFNVSNDNRPIAGQFENCHGEVGHYSSNSHLNIFTNGFIS